MIVKEIEIDKIIPYWKNPRKNDRTVERLVLSIKEYGFNVPIVVDKDMVLITGHARLKAARKLGLKTVPCVVTDLTEEKAKKYRIADNKIQELTEWDDSVLLKELQEIGNETALMEMGFSISEISDVIADLSSLEAPDITTETPSYEVHPAVDGGASPAETQPVAVNVTVAAAPKPVEFDKEAMEAKLREQLEKREKELNGRFIKESYEQHSKDNLIVCPHCGESFKVRGLT